jgi:hypothetical protein
MPDILKNTGREHKIKVIERRPLISFFILSIFYAWNTAEYWERE